MTLGCSIVPLSVGSAVQRNEAKPETMKCSLKAPNAQGFPAVFLLATWEFQALAKSHAGFPTGQAKCPFCPTTLASWSESTPSATGPQTVCWRWLGIPWDMRKGEQVMVSHATKIALSFRQGNTGTFTFPGPSLPITWVQDTFHSLRGKYEPSG